MLTVTPVPRLTCFYVLHSRDFPRWGSNVLASLYLCKFHNVALPGNITVAFVWRDFLMIVTQLKHFYIKHKDYDTRVKHITLVVEIFGHFKYAAVIELKALRPVKPTTFA